MLFITGDASKSKRGVPSLLGRGGVFGTLDAGLKTIAFARWELKSSSSASSTSFLAFSTSISAFFGELKFVDDFLGGGLCGGPCTGAMVGVPGFLVFGAVLSPVPNPIGALYVACLCGRDSTCSTVALCGLFVVTGGEKTGNLVCDVLACLSRPIFVECTTPGEYEDNEVGVEPRLHMPGDSEYLVEGVLAEGIKGVVAGGGG